MREIPAVGPIQRWGKSESMPSLKTSASKRPVRRVEVTAIATQYARQGPTCAQVNFLEDDLRVGK